MTLQSLGSIKARYDHCFSKMEEAQAHWDRGEHALALAMLAALAQEAEALDLITIATSRLEALDEDEAPEMVRYFRSILAP